MEAKRQKATKPETKHANLLLQSLGFLTSVVAQPPGSYGTKNPPQSSRPHLAQLLLPLVSQRPVSEAAQKPRSKANNNFGEEFSNPPPHFEKRLP